MFNNNSKTILVTGCAGFIGSNFVPYFLEKYLNYNLVNLDLLTYAGDLENLKECEANPRYKFIKGEDGFKSNIAFLRLPPKKAAFPLHYHEYSEETFYIISGEGMLETKEGKQEVKTGDIIFFPTGSEGMHKLTNNSAVEDLLYIDFDTYVPLDITYYPGKDKIGIFGEHYTGVLRKTSAVDLYEGEEDN